MQTDDLTRPCDPRRAERGFSILSVTVSTALLGLIMALALQSMSLGQSAASEGTQLIRTEQTLTQALDVMVPELRQSGPAVVGSGLKVDATGQTLSFRINEGFKNGALVWSAPIVYAYAAAARTLTRQEGTAEPTIFASDVTEDLQFVIGPEGDQVFIRIGCQIDAHGPSLLIQDTVTLRN